MAGKYIMALDQGTTSSRCIIYDRTGQQISVCQKEFRQIFKTLDVVIAGITVNYRDQLVVQPSVIPHCKIA